MSYLYLVVAIVTEVAGTWALKASDTFTKPLPVVVMVLGYAISFYFLALTMRTMPVGIACAIWSAVANVLITTVGAAWFRQRLDLPAVIGIGLIVCGVVVINAFSRTVAQ